MKKLTQYPALKSNKEDVKQVLNKESSKSRERCQFDIQINCHGRTNIYNYAKANDLDDSPTTDTTQCYPLIGTCIPVVPGAKHKQSRDQKLTNLANRATVPSAFAAGAIHMARRFLSGKNPANSLEERVFSTFGRVSKSVLSCMLTAFDATPLRQRTVLYSKLLNLDVNQPLDEPTLSSALAKELLQRTGVSLFNDPNGTEAERPGKIRVFDPNEDNGEVFDVQVRICSINGLRTFDFSPSLSIGDYTLEEIQQTCELKFVDKVPQSICEIQTQGCPGSSVSDALGNITCLRVLEIPTGDSVILEGVNFFSTDAKVRLLDRLSEELVQEVEAYVFGDIDTPVTEEINGINTLITDCRVHDRITFQIPNGIAPAIYKIVVVVPNITGISSLGTELLSNQGFIKVVPSPDSRFQIVVESIKVRAETSPRFLGSDEVGLSTMAFAVDTNFNVINPPQIELFEDIQQLEFDTGTLRNIERVVFSHDQPIQAMLMVVLGYEIDSRDAFSQQITDTIKLFIDIVKDQAAFLGSALAALGGASALTKLGWTGGIIAGIGLALVLGIDYLVALWAPADLIIEDRFPFTINDLATLTSVNAPPPPSFEATTESGIVITTNFPPTQPKVPFQFVESRQYFSEEEESAYILTYRFNQVQ